MSVGVEEVREGGGEGVIMCVGGWVSVGVFV